MYAKNATEQDSFSKPNNRDYYKPVKLIKLLDLYWNNFFLQIIIICNLLHTNKVVSVVWSVKTTTTTTITTAKLENQLSCFFSIRSGHFARPHIFFLNTTDNTLQF